jgi:hypothetical protein
VVGDAALVGVSARLAQGDDGLSGRSGLDRADLSGLLAVGAEDLQFVLGRALVLQLELDLLARLGGEIVETFERVFLGVMSQLSCGGPIDMTCCAAD